MVMADSSAQSDTPSVVVRDAWRRDDPDLERDAIAFWRRLGILPPGTTPEARAKELCCLIYLDGEVGAVGTATLELVRMVRARMGMVRVAVGATQREQGLAIRIVNESKAVLERWSIEHPEEKLMGIGAVIEAAGHDHWKNRPKWAPTGLDLIGHLQNGNQVRVAWFDHARLDAEA
jgi:hypothetical protein